MSVVETVKTLIAALQSGDIELAATLLSDDFECTGLATPRMFKKNHFLALHSELVAAMPDFSYNLRDIHRGEGHSAHALTRISGTQTAPLSLPMLGLNALAETGLEISLPETPTVFEVEQGQVKRMELAVVAGGGITGLVQQIGSELPLLTRRGDIAD